MPTIPVRDSLNQQRMFDLTVDAYGNVIIIAKLGKIKVSTPLSDVIAIAKTLKPDLAV